MSNPSPVDPQSPEEVPAPQSPAGSELPEWQPSPVPAQYPPAPFAPMAPPPAGERPKTLGVLALVFGAAALLFGLIPFAGIFIGGLFGTASIVLGIIGILKSHKVMSIIGIVLSVVGAIVSFSIVSFVADEVSEEIGTSVEIEASAEDDAAGEEPAGEPAEAAAAVIGDTVTDGDFEFTVTAIEQGVAEIGDEFLKEEAQGEFVIIDLTVKNIGSEPSYFSDSDQKLFDVDGNEYSVNSAAGLYLESNDIWFTEINPGNQVEGKIVFDVPAGTALATLELHDFLASGGVEVSLQ